MIIGIHGTKGSGKDTIANCLIEHFEFTKHAFADSLKEAVANLFGISTEQVDDLKQPDSIGCKGHLILQINGTTEYDYTWREFLQRFGTEMGRNTFGRNFWVDLWEDYLYRQSMQEDNVVAPDVRFQNEAAKIQELGGIIVRVTRPGYEPDGHESEEPLPNIMMDAEITNNGTLEDLQVDVFELYKGLTRDAG